MARILVVDDSLVVVDSVSQALHAGGHVVVSTNNAPDALCRLSDKPTFELILLDLALQNSDGHSLLANMGASGPPVVIMTGAGSLVADFPGTSVRRVLTKPFDLADLDDAVASILAPAAVHPDLNFSSSQDSLPKGP